MLLLLLLLSRIDNETNGRSTAHGKTMMVEVEINVEEQAGRERAGEGRGEGF